MALLAHYQSLPIRQGRLRQCELPDLLYRRFHTIIFLDCLDGGFCHAYRSREHVQVVVEGKC